MINSCPPSASWQLQLGSAANVHLSRDRDAHPTNLSDLVMHPWKIVANFLSWLGNTVTKFTSEVANERPSSP